MQNTNVVMLVGRLVRDVKLEYTRQGTAIANIGLAVKDSEKHGDQWTDWTSFFNGTMYGKTAEALEPYLRKGKKVCVTGSLKQKRWEKDGQKFSSVEIKISTLELLEQNSSQNNVLETQDINQELPPDDEIPFE